MEDLNKAGLAKKIKIFADGIDLESIPLMIDKYHVTGFTTNPSLMAKLGVKDYETFAHDMLSKTNGYPVSFEVIADDLDEMRRQAERISQWGENAYVKIPITNTQGVPTYDIIKQLSAKGVKLNITAIFTKEQLDGLEGCFNDDIPAVVSIFAGRIADAGQNPSEYIEYAADKFRGNKNVSILWASTREPYNVIQAIEAGAHIITATGDVIKKLDNMGKDLSEFSRETVQMFRNDAIKSGFTL